MVKKDKLFTRNHCYSLGRYLLNLGHTSEFDFYLAVEEGLWVVKKTGNLGRPTVIKLK